MKKQHYKFQVTSYKLRIFHATIITSSHRIIISSAFCFLLSTFCMIPPCSAQSCPKPKANTPLAVNNINAPIHDNGILFQDKFEVPNGSGKGTIYSAGLWLGGLDAQNNLHLAAMKFGQLGNDYWAGPLSSAGMSAGSYYDRIWRITKEEIENHKRAIASHDPAYIIPSSILHWPAHGRTQYGESYYLAPYKNVSGNASYTPQEGDYPLIKGDEALFFVMNDDCGVHSESNGAVIGVEIMGMAYAFTNPNSALQHTIFLSYEIRNKSENNYHNFYLSFFADFDIGDSYDDYVGCDTALNLGYGYNGTEIDGAGESWAYGEHPPAQGAMFLNKKMNVFMYFNNDLGFSMKYNALDFYCYMQGKWLDGTPLTYGGSGYNEGSTDYTQYAFSGDPETGTGWTEVTPNGPVSTPNEPWDRRGVMSNGPFNLNACETVKIDIALPWARDMEGDNLTSVTLLKKRAKEIQDFYDGTIGIDDYAITNDKLLIYPNPTTGELRMENGEWKIADVEIYDVYGRKHKAESRKQKQEIGILMDISGLEKGIYFVKITTDSGFITKKIIKL